jgi:hypothetical protein
LFGSISCLVSPEWEANRRSHKRVEAAMNARNMTRLVVTPEAEVANPWGAVCGESRTHGFDAGVGKRAHQSTAPCPKRPKGRRRAAHSG